MTRRVVTSVSRDLKGRIEWLHGDGDWSPVSSAEAARGIRAGVHSYVVDSAAGTASIHSFKDDWVRTAADGTLGDNLDELSDPSVAGVGTGRYRLVAQLRADAVATLARALHGGGTITRTFSWMGGGWELTALLGVPQFLPDGAGLLVTRTAWCTVRPIDPARGVPFDAVATTTTRVTVASAVAHGEARLTLAFADATRPIICETPLPADQAAVITSALSAFLARPEPGRTRLPLTGPMTGAKQLDLELDAAGTARMGASATKFHGPVFVHNAPDWPWSIGLSRPAVAELLAEAVRGELGALPPPWGRAASVDIGGGAELTYLEFGLRQGAVVVRGRVRKPGPPPVSADFTALIGVSIGANGELTTRLINTTVDVVEWYAELADFMSGGAISRAVDGALRASLAPMASGAMDGVLDDAFLQRLVAVGTTAQSGLRASPRRVWVEQGAVWVGGDLEFTAPAGTANLVAVGTTASIETSTLFGANIVRVVWDVDGEQTAQEYEAITLRRDLGAGAVNRTVTVSIWTDDGAVHTASTTVPPAP